LYGWNLVIKRVLDVVGASAALVVFSPVLCAIAVLVKLTSPGPVFFRQLRMGLDGQAFEMLKFRSMKLNAESETGPVWTQPNDDRRTPIGAFLRRTSLDELPQFWNVLRGEMSIVGPRPERPEFIARFRETLPQYMLRHKMKAGITRSCSSQLGEGLSTGMPIDVSCRRPEPAASVRTCLVARRILDMPEFS
jgi:lipopolysaccharide/colanic/teichoic acid biosynthesis glycosyltransferase